MSRSKKIQPINERIAQDKGLSALLKRANHLADLNKRLQPALPAPVKGLCQLANIRGEIAVFTCENQAAASKVRMFSRDILQLMQKEYKISVKKLRVVVQQAE
ncbi:MAG: DUF721 domain-containing protein [Proteobacteria bacterium]|nr:MAG: DUF721 domain-containing protein [Pseudomonadota bacterium]